MKDLCELYDIKLIFAGVSHPQSDESIERFHSTLCEIIRIIQAEHSKGHPLNVVPYVINCYNNTKIKRHEIIPHEHIFNKYLLDPLKPYITKKYKYLTVIETLEMP